MDAAAHISCMYESNVQKSVRRHIKSVKSLAERECYPPTRSVPTFSRGRVLWIRETDFLKTIDSMPTHCYAGILRGVSAWCMWGWVRGMRVGVSWMMDFLLPAGAVSMVVTAGLWCARECVGKCVRAGRTSAITPWHLPPLELSAKNSMLQYDTSRRLTQHFSAKNSMLPMLPATCFPYVLIHNTRKQDKNTYTHPPPSGRRKNTLSQFVAQSFIENSRRHSLHRHNKQTHSITTVKKTCLG